VIEAIIGLLALIAIALTLLELALATGVIGLAALILLILQLLGVNRSFSFPS
jgi:hypothetical protein